MGFLDKQKEKEIPIEDAVVICQTWIGIRDSIDSLFYKSVYNQSNENLYNLFCNSADSIRDIIDNMIDNEKRTFEDVIFFRLNTIPKKENEVTQRCDKIITSYDNLTLHQGGEKIIQNYMNFLKNAAEADFSTLSSILNFYQEEDRWFRSLLPVFSRINNDDTQYISNTTSKILHKIDEKASSLTEEEQSIFDTMTIMRFNRRIILNTIQCQQDIQNNVKIYGYTERTYRGVLMQPFLLLDESFIELMNDQEKGKLMQVARHLPQLLHSTSPEGDLKEIEESVNKIGNFMLKIHLSNLL